MADFTAKDVAFLRKETGAPMMDCKKALESCDGNFVLAKDWLRAKGLKTADKKSSRSTEEGLVAVKTVEGKTALAKVYCETDFVARTDDFVDFCNTVLDACIENGNAESVDSTKAIATLGENIKIGDTLVIENDHHMVSYIHNKVSDNTGKMAVVISYEGSTGPITVDAVRKIAMHVAATDPTALSIEELDDEWIEKERAFLINQAMDSGKPEEIVRKMVDGRMYKFLKEATLLNQEFVVMPSDKVTVEQFADANNVNIKDFTRFSL